MKLFDNMTVIFLQKRVLAVLVGLFFLGSIFLPATVLAAPLAPFNPDKVSLGITPTGWVNDDDPTIDDNIPFEQIVSEMALAGFEGSSKGHKYPNDNDELLAEMKLRGLRISEPWVGTYFTLNKMEKQIWDTFENQVAFMKAMGGNTIVVAELGGAVHQQQEVAPIPNKPNFTDEQWDRLIAGLNEMGKKAAQRGMKLCYHPHMGTGVMVMDEIDRLMENTDPQYVKLLLDTGHLYYAGVDPLEVATKYADRIGHVHLKNIRQKVMDASIKNQVSFLNSIRDGVFTVPGDKAGAINFDPILKVLSDANYEGWLIVEAEQDPKTTNPLKNAFVAREYLKNTTGL